MRQTVQSERSIKNFLPFYSARKNIPHPNIHFNDGPVVENPGDGQPIKVRFMLGDHCEYETQLGPGEWAKADKKFAAVWKIEISDCDGAHLYNHIFDTAQKKVRINIDSRSLGDTLAWIPQIEAYKKAHRDTKVFVCHFWPTLGFESEYTELYFIDPGQHFVPESRKRPVP